MLKALTTSFILSLLILRPVRAEDCQQIKCVGGGTVLLDGNLEAVSAIQENRYFELVQTSTPTTPSVSSHARLYLLSEANGKQGLRIIFGDGTAVKIAGN